MKLKSLLFALAISITSTIFSQRNDRGLNFGNTPLPSNLRGFASWDLITGLSDDFNHNNKNSAKFRDVWAQSYLPDPGFRGPGSTVWQGGNLVEVRNGRMEVRARPGSGGLVNCGIVSSKRTIRYPVYMEARIKVSNIRNSSNFWMLNKCDNEEIDVLECYGGDPDEFYSKQMSTNFHLWHRRGGQSHGGAQTTTNCGGRDLTDFTYQTFFRTSNNDFWRNQFHTFGVYWASPTQLEFYIDGVPRFDGQHFVSGRVASGLNGSFANARMQCPNAAVLNCTTEALLRNVQGQSGGGVPYPNREFNDPTHIIIDTEAHAGRPVESVGNLNNNNKNVMLVDWVRVYRPTIGGGGPTPPPPPPNNGGGNAGDGAPIGSIISLRKTGGDRKFVSAVTELSNDLYANQNRVFGNRQKFRVDRHRSGVVALYSLSARKYVQSNRNNQNVILRARGNSDRNWERFEWRNVGNNRVAFRSVQANRWVQAAWNRDNAPLFPKGAAPRGWETFEWRRESGAKVLDDALTSETIAYPNPILGGNDVIIEGINQGDTIILRNSSGAEISTTTASGTTENISTNNLASGIYFIQINNTKTLKLIVD
ncbi:T9SS type A sorting domain-containing protein [Aquimarina agarivorans]|uniref:T9SS type A sorting domain-containing protein n=1 Tax=Aquimarina agarivorans TaxID=980584 RepID=UPI000248FD01|nr:T9SS type A sorting domain-containing protein [Aquimarina agarivorans]